MFYSLISGNVTFEILLMPQSFSSCEITFKFLTFKVDPKFYIDVT